MKITKSKLKQLIREEYTQTLDEELLFEAEKGEWVAKIVGYVKKLAARYGPELIDMIIDKLKDAAMDALAGQGSDTSQLDL